MKCLPKNTAASELWWGSKHRENSRHRRVYTLHYGHFFEKLSKNYNSNCLTKQGPALIDVELVLKPKSFRNKIGILKSHTVHIYNSRGWKTAGSQSWAKKMLIRPFMEQGAKYFFLENTLHACPGPSLFRTSNLDLPEFCSPVRCKDA